MEDVGIIYKWTFGLFYVQSVYFMSTGYILWSLGIFCGHLVYFVVIWYILWSFGIFCGHLVYFVVIWYILWSFGIFLPFWYVSPRKIWQPCPRGFYVHYADSSPFSRDLRTTMRQRLVTTHM
jgi:hypothetical protein